MGGLPRCARNDALCVFVGGNGNIITGLLQPPDGERFVNLGRWVVMGGVSGGYMELAARLDARDLR